MFRLTYSPKIVPITLVLTVIICGLVPSAAHSQVDPPAVVRIGHLENVSLGDTITVPITLDSVGAFSEIGGFDLMVFFDNGALTYLGASLGDLPTGCAWEYFSARADTIGLVRVVALAETNNGAVHPTCYLGSTGVLAELTFVVSANPVWHGLSYPFFFAWKDCGDNVLAVPTGDTILVSDRVFKYDGTELTVDSTLPTFGGAPTSCLTAGPGTVLRGVDFIDGAVDVNGQGQPGPSVVTLQSKTDVGLGTSFNLALQYTPSNTPPALGGFDFLLRYDRSALQFDGAVQGALLDTCAWEYFTFRTDSVGSDGLVRLVALADINDANTPLCYAEEPGTLATLSFTSGSDSSLLGASSDIEWYWTDCSDNLMSNPSGDSIYFSADVFSADGAPITADSALPGIFGAPQTCLGSAPNNVRAVDYHSGRVTFESAPVVDNRGDINLNGVPWEQADYNLLVDYFHYGTAVFTIDSILQLQAANVFTPHGDPRPDMTDIVLFYEIVRGLRPASTWWVPGGNAYPEFIQDLPNGTVSLGGADSMAAVILTFEGTVVPTLTNPASGLEMWYETAGNQTRVMIYPGLSDTTNQRPGILPGQFLTIAGAGYLTAVGSADYDYDVVMASLGFGTSDVMATLQIAYLQNVVPGDTIQVPINLADVQPGFGTGGLDLLLKYDSEILTLLDIQPGALLQSCGWELFDWRSAESAECGGTCPDGLTRIIAVADGVVDPGHPSCFADRDGQLAVMTFAVSDSAAYDCTLTPIDWWWYDCVDNSASTLDGSELIGAASVIDFDGRTIPLGTTFPNNSGPIPTCYDGTGGVATLRFQHGAIDILCTDSLDNRGDLNLNGIAYEVSDEVLYANFFVYGPAVFWRPEAQVQTSDVNADGLRLMLEDFVYLRRVIIGDALPYPKPVLAAGDTAIVTQDAATSSISIEYPGTLSAAHFIFGGEVQITSLVPDHQAWYDPNSTPYSRSLVVNPDPFLWPAAFPPTDTGLTVATYTGTGTLIHAEVAGDGTAHIPVKIVTVNLPPCCELRGNINGLGQIDISDITMLVAFLFGDGLPPGCPEGADVDGSGGDQPVTVSDLTYLVSYVFAGGPAPGACQ